jgi:hypothetical protein
MIGLNVLIRRLSGPVQCSLDSIGGDVSTTELGKKLGVRVTKLVHSLVAEAGWLGYTLP